ncbi:MAG: anti-sigma factor [Alphaproteobacteria bacterium]|nr:anti-sigma factor [Alphaproteobacteria bacterium]
MTEEERDRLAGEHVLGLLEGEAAAAAERLAERDPDFAAAVALWRARFFELDLTASPERPPAALWQRIEAGIAAPAAAPARPVRRAAAWGALWDSLAFWRIAGLGTAAASILLALGLATLWQQRATTPVLVAVLLTDDRRAGAVVNAFADGRTELLPLGDIPVPPGRALEIWTLWDRARGPVSVGLIDRARTVRLRVDDLPRARPDQLFEITLEPATGSPIGRPTGPVLMKGTASRAL